MKQIPKAAVGRRTRKLSVRFSEPEYRTLSVLAHYAGHTNPSAFLCFLGRKAMGAESEAGATSPGPLASAIHRNGEIEQMVVGLSTQVAHLENLIGDVLERTAQIEVANHLLRSAILQAASASYMIIHVWRLLADEAQRPPAGLPPHMLAEIQDLHRRIITAAETKAG